MDENHLLRPVDVNGINKMAGEWYHILYNNVYRIRACALRLTNTIGPRMRIKDARQTFLGIWIRLLLEGKAFEVWGGEQLRDFTYVDDAVDAFLMAATSEDANGQVFNLGCERVINLKDLADLMVEINGSGRYELRSFPPDRKRIDIGDYYADFTRIRSVLGWEPKVPLREALVRFPALAERMNTPAGNLSGGQQKMVEFAKAWLVRPRLCLVDEPSVGLAPIVAAEVYRYIETFASEGMTILLVDHNVRRVVKMSEYVYVLSLGEIAARGRRQDFEGDLHAQVRAWLGVNF